MIMEKSGNAHVIFEAMNWLKFLHADMTRQIDMNIYSSLYTYLQGETTECEISVNNVWYVTHTIKWTMFLSTKCVPTLSCTSTPAHYLWDLQSDHIFYLTASPLFRYSLSAGFQLSSAQHHRDSCLSCLMSNTWKPNPRFRLSWLRWWLHLCFYLKTIT